jgi:NADH-quinone oxidoreductase subunit N
MVAILVSLVGIPPFAGFPAKFAIFATLVAAGGPVMITLLVIAGLNTAVSLVYYIRVIKTMTIDTPDEERPISGLRFLPATFVAAVTLPVLVLGIWFDGVYSWAAEATRQLF